LIGVVLAVASGAAKGPGGIIAIIIVVRLVMGFGNNMGTKR
jgi:hypothetical protein